MPPATNARPATRKRTRKRKRRVASSSSSSSDSESDASSTNPTQPIPVHPVVSKPPEPSSSESSSDSSSDSSDTDSVSAPLGPPVSTATSKQPDKPRPPRRMSSSPSPPPAEIPPFITTTDLEAKESQEQLMKAKFRKFWMASIADGFKDDLEEIRKEPNLGTSRLSLLIDALASGADVFSSSSQSSGANINEIEVILQENDMEH